MQSEIITIGDEILIGQIVDSNSAWIAAELNKLNISVHQITSVSDAHGHIIEALTNAGKYADLVIITGGLGPTKDDITKLALCDYFNTRLINHPLVLEDIKNLIEKRTGFLNELNRQQADVPESCTVLRNKIGTAPGLWFKKEKTIYVSLPGVPFEMKELMLNEVIPRLQTNLPNQQSSIIHKTIGTTGIAESTMAEMLHDWETNLPDVLKIAYLPSPGNNRIRISARGSSSELLENEIQKAVKGLQQILGVAIVDLDNLPIEVVVGKKLTDWQQTLATAESCTGGNIAHLITSIAGSSAYFKGAVVAYANETKQNVLNIEASVIEEFGAVSQQVVERMATNVRQLMQTTYGIATSGIAGPGGERPDKPVGTTWMAVATPEGVISQKIIFGENRQRNIQRASIAALNMLRINMKKFDSEV